MYKKLILILLIFSFNHLFSAGLITAKTKLELVDAYARTVSEDLHLLFVKCNSVSSEGLSESWTYQYAMIDSFYYFQATLDTVFLDTTVSSEGFTGAAHISMDWVDSDSALMLANQQGGDEFCQQHPDYHIKALLSEALVPYSYPNWYITYISKSDSSERELITVNATIPNIFPPPQNFSLKHNYDLMNIFKLNWDAPDTTLTVAKLEGYYIYRNFEICDTLPPDSTNYTEIEPPIYSISDNNVYYCLKAFYEKPEGISLSTDTLLHRGDAISIDENDEINSNKFLLHQNYPNPFNPTTTISFSLPQKDRIKLQIFDLRGNLIKTLIDGNQDAGKYNINWKAENYPSGIYFYQLQTDVGVLQKKCILLK